jgi:hypothetical protein
VQSRRARIRPARIEPRPGLPSILKIFHDLLPNRPACALMSRPAGRATRMNMQIQGKIHAAFEAEQVTERFRKREFVLELDAASRYPQYVMFQLTGDRCSELDGFGAGEEIKVEFSLRGREWKSPKGDIRYFNSLEVWSIDRVGDAPDAGPSVGQSGEPPPPSDEDDIPF